LLTCNKPEYAVLPSGQIVPALADQKLFYSCGEDFVYRSESSFYRLLHMEGQCHSRWRAHPPQEPRPVPRLRADRPNALWSSDISFLPTTVRDAWLYLYLVVDVWSRKVVAWDVAEVESAQIAADLVQRACLKERYRRLSGFGSGQCHQPSLILHADNGNA
jgi:putative transposase